MNETTYLAQVFHHLRRLCGAAGICSDIKATFELKDVRDLAALEVFLSTNEWQTFQRYISCVPGCTFPLSGKMMDIEYHFQPPSCPCCNRPR